MSREVLQQALEAMEASDDSAESMLDAMHEARKVLAQPDNTSKLYEELRVLIDGGSESFTHKDAVQYLKDISAPLKWTPEDTAYRPGGLAQLELSDYQCCDCKTRLFCGAVCHVCGSFSAEDIPQEHPEQMARLGWQYFECPACGSEGARAFPKPEQEPAYMVEKTFDLVREAFNAGLNKNFEALDKCEKKVFPLLLRPPPQRQRQPLTDEQIQKLAASLMYTKLDYSLAFARAIEAAHGIGDKT